MLSLDVTVDFVSNTASWTWRGKNDLTQNEKNSKEKVDLGYGYKLNVSGYCEERTKDTTLHWIPCLPSDWMRYLILKTNHFQWTSLFANVIQRCYIDECPAPLLFTYSIFRYINWFKEQYNIKISYMHFSLSPLTTTGLTFPNHEASVDMYSKRCHVLSLRSFQFNLLKIKNNEYYVSWSDLNSNTFCKIEK